ncbi:MAG: hypothetical protein JNK82_04415 [Myxococcaceae bacterium]|nr:hypothetical protein [Myxococcaceae bacterium]
MQPTPVRIGTMDIARPKEVATLPVRALSLAERVWRASKLVFGVSGSLLVIGNIALLLLPVPHLHLCLFPLAFILGPLLGYFAWRDRVVFGRGEVPCPKCHEPVAVPDGTHGYPARFNCPCGIRLELKPAA